MWIQWRKEPLLVWWLLLLLISYSALSPFQEHICLSKWNFTERILNIFIKCADYLHKILWLKPPFGLTVILAVSRYVAVSHPVRAPQYMRCIRTVIAVLTCTIIWILVDIPFIYTWEVFPINSGNSTIYHLDYGKFAPSTPVKSPFNDVYCWFGFILPIILLAYCNFKLTHSLRILWERRNQCQEGETTLAKGNQNV